MGSSFRPPRFEIREDKGEGEKAQIIKTGESIQPVVEPFEVTDLKADPESAGAGMAVRAGGRAPSAAAETAPAAPGTQRDHRFVMSPFIRDALFVTAEENRLLEERVESRVTLLAEAECARAREQGFAEGERRGYEDAFARFSEEGRSRLERFDALLAELEGARSELFRRNEGLLIDLIFRIGRKVLLRELSTDREYLTRLATTLIERTGLRENLRIRIHPRDAETAEKLKEGVQGRLGALRNLAIEVSPTVVRGGCVLESDWGMVDASVETQLDEIFSALGGPLPGGAAPADLPDRPREPGR